MWLHAIAGVFALSQLRVAINVPAYRLDVFIADTLERSMPVAVGMPRFRTPRGAFAITSIEWNPWWIPPDRPWAEHERPAPPGPGNPMGRVKLSYAPLYYLHGTPFEASIGSAASHGCIRLRNADVIQLARLAHRYGTPSMTPVEIEGLMADTVHTREVALDSPIPLDIGYRLAELRDGFLSVYRDIYRLATRPLRDDVYALLVASGLDTARVDATRLSTFIAHIAAGGNVVAVDSLMRARAPVSPRSSRPDTTRGRGRNSSSSGALRMSVPPRTSAERTPDRYGGSADASAQSRLVPDGGRGVESCAHSREPRPEDR